MRKTLIRFAGLVLACAWAQTTSAQVTPAAGYTPPDDTPSIKVGATIYTNYTYQSDPKGTDASKNSISPNSFEDTRAYINVTGNISHLVSFRITPDIAGRFSTAATTTTTTTTTIAGVPGATATSTSTSTTTASTSYDGSLVYRLKYAFGQLNLDEWATKGTWLRLGQQQTPLIDYLEGIYRYRFQNNVFVEKEGFLSSADVGFSGHYTLPNEYGDFHLGVYNGDTYSKAEANDQKAIQGRLSLRPLPKETVLKGLRVNGFFDQDKPISGGKRDRLYAGLTFEHPHVNAGFDYIDAKDKGTATATELDATGYSFWVTPRTNIGIEGFFRYDNLKPNKNVDARKKRTMFGAAYWFKTTAKPAAAAIMADWENVSYDTLLAKPQEKRFGIHALLNF